MDYDKLIEHLRRRGLGNGCALGPHSGLYDDAATALSTLQAENAQLRADLEYEREHADAYYEECGQWEAENEKLRDEMKQERAHRLHAEQHADAFLEDCKRLNAELEQVKWENNALWTYIEIVDREYRRYMDMGYIDRLDELRRTWRRGQKDG